MSVLVELKAATSLRQLASCLGYKPSSLSYVLFKLPPARKYRSFTIPKRYGGTRTISAPCPELKLVQRRLATLLTSCIVEVNDASNSPDRISHGFKPGHSIVTNARQHRGKRYVFNVDLADFFGTINFGRVLGFFRSDRNLALHPEVATVVAQIACHNNSLPQGSPCSPVISNLIGHILDIHLVRIAAKYGCTYTRYADDLTFSTNKRSFPTQIAERSTASPNLWHAGHALHRIVQKSGFAINAAKVRMQYRDSRQEVTGLVVNRRINVRKEYRHTVRAMVHRLFTKGHFQLVTNVPVDVGPPWRQSVSGSPLQLHGMLGFIDSIDLQHRAMQNEQVTPRLRAVAPFLSNKERIYRRFLLFSEFYAAPAPVIVCEGKTDNIYLLHAIRKLASHFPRLASVSKDGTVSLGVRLYRYTDSSTARILGMSGGAPGLQHFLQEYLAELHRFSAPGKKHPVIVLLDNDEGAVPTKNLLRSKFHLDVKFTDPHTHLGANLYLMPTPLVGGAAKSSIEDFFDSTVRNAVLDGKTLSTASKFDTSKHYGKTVFAHRVIVPNADKINFAGFEPLLNRLDMLVAAHAKRFP